MSGANTSPGAGDGILTLRDVEKSYGGVRAVRGISMTIPKGCIYGFLGPNGAGKTTTIRSIMNIVPPDAGEILVEGRPLSRAHLDRVGYLPEERGLYRKMTCREQLVFLAELKGLSRRDAAESADLWLDRIGLPEWGPRKVDALSKGMQQKIQFAATFHFGPELVILDEPFSGLDPLNIDLLRELILAERERGCTIIFSTHMLAEAEKICDAICLIDGGEKILDGRLDDVRRAFPLEVVRVAYADGSTPPDGLPGVTLNEKIEGEWRLILEKGSDPAALLPALTAAGPLSLFRANRPTLDEIFLAAVRGRREKVAAGEVRA